MSDSKDLDGFFAKQKKTKKSKKTKEPVQPMEQTEQPTSEAAVNLLAQKAADFVLDDGEETKDVDLVDEVGASIQDTREV